MDKVILKKGRDKSVRKKHPWIFSGAIETMPKCDQGTIFPIYSHEGEFLAQGYFNPENSLAGRIFTFEQGDPKTLLRAKLEKALALRKTLFDPQKTNAYRLINGEGDGIPGLIVDIYADYGVIQIHTSGLENLRIFLVEELTRLLPLKGIYEKSLSPARQEEKLPPQEGVLFGEVPEAIEILENGLTFAVSPSLGQKTGFFLDQRLMRDAIRTLSKGKSVLSLFSYTGSFGLYALHGGATHATSVDISKTASTFAEKNTQLNLLDNHTIIEADAFAFLEDAPLDQDLIMIDPPAFAKKKKHRERAVQAYRSLNEQVLKKMKVGAFLLTSSCSYYVDQNLFEMALAQAAQNAGRNVQILGRHIQAPDHPTALPHPEGSYLKSLLLFVES